MAKFQVFRDASNQYRWRLRSSNGQIIATAGESFVNKAGAQNGVAAVKRDAAAAEVEDQA